MKILRNKNFSKKEKKEEEKKPQIKGDVIAGGAASAAIGVGSSQAGKESNSYFAKRLLKGKGINPGEEKILREKLIERAKKQGTGVLKRDAPNSFATESTEGKLIRPLLKKLAKKDRKTYKSLRESADEQMAGALENLGRDRIVLGNGRLSEADVLSHELGHTQYMHKGRSKNVVAKAAHRLNALSKFGTTGVGEVTKSYPATAAAYGIHGYASGIKAAKDESEGKKESKWNKVRAVAVPAMVSAPMLIAEGAASRKGLRFLKEAGASKEAMKIARKSLGSAYGTYASLAAGNVVAGEGGRLVGKAVGKRRGKKDKREKKNENTKD